ncbi:MAG: M28 family peptidase [Xenococcaceae cyanobacterium MO_188.B29]|nr:M28 family peptidase [Xenococcaceae cyanobacterium MO_188.B29]
MQKVIKRAFLLVQLTSLVIFSAIAGQCRLAQAAIMIAPLIDDVSAENIEAHIDMLSNEIGARDTEERQAQAANYIANQFREFGYTVTLEPVQNSTNIIARLSGSVDSNQVFVVGSHFDSVPGSPGADDNASGVAGMLEIARVLSNVQPDFSIEFVIFALEEEIVVGSTEYVENISQDSQQDVIGMIALEMIGYYSTEANSQIPFASIPSCLSLSEEGRSTGDFIANVGNNNSTKLLQTFQEAANTYVPDLRTLTAQVADNGRCFPDTRRSDHSPFWDEGYQALMITDTANFRNPNYHQPSDILDTLNLTFARQVTQAALATTILSTQSVPEPSLLMLISSTGVLFLLSRRYYNNPK